MALTGDNPDYSVEGSKPIEITNHMIAKTYIITGITPEDFTKEHGGLAIDLEQLKEEFKKHCDDYEQDLIGNVKSKALEFCSKVIYIIGPESRKVKKGTGDKTWKFVFTPANPTEQKHTVFVSTYKQENADCKMVYKPHHMTLTLKQAALICHDTFDRMVRFAIAKDGKQLLMTPLAGACFSRDDVPTLANALRLGTAETMSRINQSTQSGGQLLPHGDVNFAICAAISATRNLKDENLKKSIVTKTVKQYIAAKKMPDKEVISIVAKYATGGVPAEFSYDELLRVYDQAQAMSALQKQRHINDSRVETDHLTLPGASAGPAKRLAQPRNKADELAQLATALEQSRLSEAVGGTTASPTGSPKSSRKGAMDQYRDIE